MENFATAPPFSGGIRLHAASQHALAAECQALRDDLRLAGVPDLLEQPVGGARPGCRFVLDSAWQRACMPDSDTTGLAARLGLDILGRPGDLERETWLALLGCPMAYDFPSHAEAAANVRMRCNTVRAARKTALAFHTATADRPEDCWTYHEGTGFTVRPGQPLIAALKKATQPGDTGRRYGFSCYRATEYVMLLGIAEELALTNPPLLARLQRQWEQRAITSEEFRRVFLHEQGSIDTPLPGGYYVPGDRVWFRNPDAYSAEATGYEGSWVLYIGNGQFTNFWTPGPHYTLHTKCVEMFQWRHTAYVDNAGNVRINEDLVEERLEVLRSDPERTAEILQKMLHLRAASGEYGVGGCLDASREGPRNVCMGTADIELDGC